MQRLKFLFLFILIPFTMQAQSDNQINHLETATLGGGCFWCTEALYKMINGVERIEPGYSGGHTPNPDYSDVCSGTSGHAEVVQITFNPQIITYRELLLHFFTFHDPTTVNRQGNDIGHQYRSVIFYHSPEQKATAIEVIQHLEHQGDFGDPIVTQVVPFSKFYPAEAYHHDYFSRNPNQPYCKAIIAPKVSKFRQSHSK